MSRSAIVIGAGLAGLSAALTLSREGRSVRLVEASAMAGGRCRTFFDARLGRRIDNGTHVVLAGNQAVERYCSSIGSADRLTDPGETRFAFHDLATGARYSATPNEGRLPWWILSPSRRVPGSGLGSALRLAPLVLARGGAVQALVPVSGPLWDRFAGPVLLAALNTAPEQASAALAGAVLRGSLLRGGKAARPRLASPDLDATFVAPALQTLARAGVELTFGKRLRAISFADDCTSALTWSDGCVEDVAGVDVILAVTAAEAARLVPGLVTPDRFHGIVNAVFAVTPPLDAPAMLGVLGGTAQWIFCAPGQISVTVSAADALCRLPRADIAALLWADVAAALQLPDVMPPWQVVKERRATFAATAEQQARRPLARTRWRNLALAGDFTNTGLPATIEGAIRSGERAARCVL